MSIFNLITTQIENLKIKARSPLLLSNRAFGAVAFRRSLLKEMAGLVLYGRGPQLGLLLVAALLLAGPTAAQDVLVSNTSNSSSGASTSATTATKFTTGDNSTGYTISSIGVFLGQVPASGTITVTIQGGSGTDPGTVIYTLSNPDALTANAVNTFTAPVNTMLAANTTYFLVAAVSNNLNVSLTADNDETGASGWSIADGSRFLLNDSWFDSDGKLRFSVSGTANEAATNPTVALSVSSFIIAEGGTNLTLTATRSEANESGAALTIPIRVKSTETTAQAADYNLSSMSISIADGSTTGTTTFSVVDDNTDEPTEEVVIELGALPDGNVAASNDEVTINITDNDATTVRISRTGNGPVSEGNTIEFTVILSRSLVNGEVINVPLSVDGTNVTSGEWAMSLKVGSSFNTGVSLISAESTSRIFNFSDLGADTATMILTLKLDGVKENAETFTIALGPDGDVPNGFDHPVNNRLYSETNVGGGADPDGTSNRFEVEVNDPLTKPVGFTATAGDGQVTLQWTNPGNSTITGYDFQQKTGGGSFGSWTTIPGSNAATTSYTVTSLTNGTAYTFRIRAVQGAVNSGPSDEATATPMTPDITITAVTASVSEDTGASFTVTAVPPPAANLDVSVSVTETAGSSFVDSNDKGPQTVTIPADSSSVTYSVATVNDETDESGGSVTVTLLDGTGYGVGSTASATVMVNDDDATSVTLAGTIGDLTEGDTKEFTVTLGRGLTNGEVLEVPLTFGGAATRNTDYTTACPNTLPEGVTCNNLNTAATPTVTFTGPKTGMTAESVLLTLTANTDGDTEGGETVDIGLGTLDTNSGTNLGGGATGTDNLAAFSIGDPPVSPVAKPAGLTATAGDEQVTLNWDDPSNSEITSYQFQQKEGSDDYEEWMVISGSDATTTTHTVSGLTNGTEYTFRIRAVAGSVVNGVESAEKAATPVAAPVKPTNFMATAGDGEVTLSWTDPSNSDITSYQYRQKAGTGNYGNWTTIPGSGATTTTHTVSGLTNGTKYTFRIRAVAGSVVNGVESAEKAATPVAAPVKPTVTIARGTSPVMEGTGAAFTVTAAPAPASSLTVNLLVTEAAGSGDFVASNDEGRKTVVISTSGSATYTVATVDDDTDEANGSVIVTIVDSDDYTVGSPSSAMVTLNDDDTTPSINSVDMIDVVEGTTTVLTVIATDADGDEPAYSVSGGADRTLFRINGTSGALTFITAPDFEDSSADGDDDYEVEVTASDGTNSAAQTITVTVINDPSDDVLGFSEAEEVSEVVIVPNPSNHYIEVHSLTVPSGDVFQILSLSGKPLLEGTTNTRVDIASLRSGLYLMQLRDGRLLKFVRE
ncbi:MAG: fibronectin type III domain-containing protein [Ekhidna sp.]|nr:fibronectin type III domain-containing protein [Ekhidna sp.]